MVPLPRRCTRSIVVLTALLAACSRDEVTAPTESPSLTVTPGDGAVSITLCKSALDAGTVGHTFDFTVSATHPTLGPGSVVSPVSAEATTFDPTKCVTVWSRPNTVFDDETSVTITEDVAPGFALERIVVQYTNPADPTIPVIDNPATPSVTVVPHHGVTVFFKNRSVLPSLRITKTAGSASVTAGTPMSFTATVTNDGPGTATGVTLSDPLPAGLGIDWSVSASDPTCVINGLPPAEVLSCTFGNLAPGASRSVTVTTQTTGAECKVYANTASAQASNHPVVQASAAITMTGCPPETTPCPAGSFTYNLNAAGDLLIRYDQFPAPNDNSYGVNAVGWPNGHSFGNLTGSDKAGFQLRDPGGVVQLSFNVDYLSANASAPSGYASLGVTGGDGDMLVGTATGITATTSLANNLNNINIPGLFNAAHVQQFGSVNVLVNSPPTDAAHQTYNISDPTLAGWDFHNTYYVTISAAKLAGLGFNIGTWTVQPNASQLHNSPAKPCPPGPAVCDLAVTKTEVKDKQVKITVANNAANDVFLSDVLLNWPAANGKLMKVKSGGDVVYDNPDISGGSAHLTLAQLVADQNKRKLGHNSSEVITLEFEHNADPVLANYSSTLTFGNCVITILP